MIVRVNMSVSLQSNFYNNSTIVLLIQDGNIVIREGIWYASVEASISLGQSGEFDGPLHGINIRICRGGSKTGRWFIQQA